jgi:Repeat of unknown function (DUF5648)
LILQNFSGFEQIIFVISIEVISSTNFMANSVILTGQLNNSDYINEARNGRGYTRSDEYSLLVSSVDQTITIRLNSLTNGYDPYLQVINANTGQVLARSEDDGGNGNSLIAPSLDNSLTLEAGINYKVQVFSSGPIVTPQSYSYNLQASVTNGDVSLIPRYNQFGTPQTGKTVTFNGQLDGTDFSSTDNQDSVSDEYKLAASLPGQPITIALKSFASDYDPVLDVINADTGEIIANSGDLNGFAPGGNALIAPGQPDDTDGDIGATAFIPSSLTFQAGINYRIRVTSGTNFPKRDTPVGQYQLQVSTPQGQVTVTPRVTPGAKKDVYRFFNTQLGTHFYTANTAERDNVINTLPQYKYEGSVFATAPVDPLTGTPNGTATTGTTPVYRFFNTQVGVHFYTISALERDNVINTLPQYNYEGIAYYAYETSQPGLEDLYRFFNTQLGTHFYTASATERDNIIATLPQYNFEGTAYFVSPVT